MTDTGKTEFKLDALEAEEKLRKETEQRDDGRRTIEQNEQQDLNQGMDTGTHSSAHGGVNWGSSYRVLPETRQTPPTKEQIAARAYELYLQRGGGDGHGLEDWLTAEKEWKQGRS
jgi:hypothetical protein